MIVAGIGFRASAPMSSLRDAFNRASGGRPVTALATAADKARSPAFQELAQVLGLSVRAIPQSELTGATTVTNSAASHAARQVGSVAEASALVAAGPGARLIGARAVSDDRMATCALAEARTGTPYEGEPT